MLMLQQYNQLLIQFQHCQFVEIVNVSTAFKTSVLCDNFGRAYAKLGTGFDDVKKPGLVALLDTAVTVNYWKKRAGF